MGFYHILWPGKLQRLHVGRRVPDVLGALLKGLCYHPVGRREGLPQPWTGQGACLLHLCLMCLSPPPPILTMSVPSALSAPPSAGLTWPRLLHVWEWIHYKIVFLFKKWILKKVLFVSKIKLVLLKFVDKILPRQNIILKIIFNFIF